MMSQMLRKRGREPEVLLDSIDVPEPKRFNGEETDRCLHLRQLPKTLADEEEECAASQDLLDGVMRTLEELISTTCSTSSVSGSGNNLAAPDICSGHEGQTVVSDSVLDLCYLLEASDDELGIPPSPVLGFKDEVRSSKETSKGLSENPDLISLGESWHFQDDFENNQWFALCENAWDASQLQADYMNGGFVSEGLLFEEDFSEAWRLETASCM